jgi:hypothetical protein
MFGRAHGPGRCTPAPVPVRGFVEDRVPSAPNAPRRRRRRPAFARRAYAVVAGLGVVVGALAGTIALLHEAFGLFVSDPPASIDARIDKVVQTRSRMPFGEYLGEAKLPRSSFSREQLAQPGYEFTVTVTITGRIGKELPLRWRMFRKPESPLPGPLYDREAVGFEPKGAKHSNSWPVWVPYPPKRGTYYVRFTLDNPNGLPADQRDSAAFTYPPR